MKRSGWGLAGALWLACGVAPVTAAGDSPVGEVQLVEILDPATVSELEPSRERPLTLTPGGDVARLLEGDAEWEEGAAPLPLDLDRDGAPDYVVFSAVDARSERRAVIVHLWGESDREFGPAVFYLIVGAGGIQEWGGRHRLPAGTAPPPASPSGLEPASGSSPAPPR